MMLSQLEADYRMTVDSGVRSHPEVDWIHSVLVQSTLEETTPLISKDLVIGIAPAMAFSRSGSTATYGGAISDFHSRLCLYHLCHAMNRAVVLPNRVDLLGYHW